MVTSCAAAQPWAGLEPAALEGVQGLHLLSGSHPPQQLASSDKGLFPRERGPEQRET